MGGSAGVIEIQDTNRARLKRIREKFFQESWHYQRCFWQNFKYKYLSNIMYIGKPGAGAGETWNDVIIMADTETSKAHHGDPDHNHVCAWSISLRAYHQNIVTLWGVRPTDFCKCLNELIHAMKGDKTAFYFHNLPYDHVFLRKFMYKHFGEPIKQLNVKPYYPIYIEFQNGIILRDSLIISQTSLAKWASDLDVPHKKQVGKWNYWRIRNQKDVSYNWGELDYIECDTLAGVECLDKYMTALGKRIYSMPWTATGIVREKIKELGRENHAHDQWKRMLCTWEEQTILEKVFHGGYTHGNRHFYGRIFRSSEGDFVYAYDFSSSYPFVMLTEKMPCERFARTRDMDLKDILDCGDQFAYMFKLTIIRPQIISDNLPMPPLQYSKTEKCINPILDNGRIIAADYVEIWTNEVDASIINSCYTGRFYCKEIHMARKDYLPRWLTDYIYQLFVEKTQLKGGDPVLYALAKARLNSCYGLFVQLPCKPEIEEVYQLDPEHPELYRVKESDETEEGMRKKYDEYCNSKKQVLNYQRGVWVTSYSMRNLFRLGSCVDFKGKEDGKKKEWLYSDTDSIYTTGMDHERLRKYNEDVKKKLLDRGYGPVLRNGKEYWLGIAEHDKRKDLYTEFCYVGAKRYCGRCFDDKKLHTTVAGVPKKGVKALRDDIRLFAPGFIFPGSQTGKKQHTHFIMPDIWIDKEGNECGDSIDLSPADYQLSTAFNPLVDDFMCEEVSIQIYEEEIDYL